MQNQVWACDTRRSAALFWGEAGSVTLSPT